MEWRHYRADGIGEVEELAPGLYGYRQLHVTCGWGREPVDVALDASWSGSGYSIHRVEVDGMNLDSASLAALPLRAVMAQAVLDTLDYSNAGQDTDEVARAAVIFRVGLIVGEAPVQLVADELSVSLNTAKRRIAAARERGLLKDDERAPQGGAALRASSQFWVGIKKGQVEG